MISEVNNIVSKVLKKQGKGSKVTTLTSKEKRCFKFLTIVILEFGDKMKYIVFDHLRSSGQEFGNHEDVALVTSDVQRSIAFLESSEMKFGKGNHRLYFSH
jgi:hypothetical protein